MTTKGEIKEITYLRAIVVMLVVLAHANVPYFGAGIIGVDI